MVGDPQERLSVEVPVELGGVRADRVLATLSGLPRSQVQLLIDEGYATVGDRPLSRRDLLEAGTLVHLDVPTVDETMVAEPMALDIVYDDEHLAVVDKPAGLVVHPGAGNASGTLVNGLLHRWPQMRGIGQPGRWGIVHRLDRDTSGVIAVAKSHDGYLGLKGLVDDRALIRRYVALVHGQLDMPTGTIDAPIGRDSRYPTRMRVQVDGRHAVTHYQVLEEFGDMTLLEVMLETGRTHQIRVHLSSIGAPVVGDRVYGHAGPSTIDPGRVWLHARSLEFEHPMRSLRVVAVAQIPEDLERSLDAARSDA